MLHAPDAIACCICIANEAMTNKHGHNLIINDPVLEIKAKTLVLWGNVSHKMNSEPFDKMLV